MRGGGSCFVKKLYTFLSITKLHLPLSLRSALLACLALFPAAYASSYVATGVNADNISESSRLYDHGQRYFWVEEGAQPIIGATELFLRAMRWAVLSMATAVCR